MNIGDTIQFKFTIGRFTYYGKGVIATISEVMITVNCGGGPLDILRHMIYE